MKRWLAPFVLIAATTVMAQQGNDLFQKALSKERVEGQLGDAIALYERVVNEFAADRALAARALVQIGRCFERLGKADAKRAYERVVQEFADQKASADEARARLAVLESTDSESQRSSAAAGPTVRRVWTDAVDLLARPADNGRFLTWVDKDGNLGLRDVTSGSIRSVVKNPTRDREYAFYSVPSPDGTLIAYSWFNTQQQYDLRVVSSANSRPRILVGGTETTYAQPVGWSSDGRRILTVLTRADHTHQIAWVDLQGKISVLKSLDWRYPRASLSPDGRYIAYALADASGAHDIRILSADGSRDSSLVEHPADDSAPVWTPDARRVLFVSNRTGTAGLWLVDVVEGRSRGDPQLVRADFGSASPLGFTRSGAFYYVVQTGRHDVFMAAIDLRRAVLLEARPAVPDKFGRTGFPTWSPDGRHLAFISDRGPIFTPGQAGRFTIRHLDSGADRSLDVALRVFLWPMWSPDGRSIAVIGSAAGRERGIYLIKPDSGEASPLVLQDPQTSVMAMDWFPNGKAVAYIVDDGTRRRILQRGIDDEAPSELGVSDHALWLAISPNARSLAVIELDEKGRRSACHLFDLTTGENKTIFQAPAGTELRRVTWSPDGTAFLAWGSSTVPGQRMPTRLWRVNVETGEVAAVDLGLEVGSASDFRFHPDGKRVGFTVRRDGAEIWVMENFLPPVRSTPATSRGEHR